MLIAVSGQYTKGNQVLAETSGYDYYVIKPCDPKALLKLVALVRQEVALEGVGPKRGGCVREQSARRPLALVGPLGKGRDVTGGEWPQGTNQSQSQVGSTTNWLF